jgi:hypothetical protein
MKCADQVLFQTPSVECSHVVDCLMESDTSPDHMSFGNPSQIFMTLFPDHVVFGIQRTYFNDWIAKEIKLSDN